MRESHGAFPPSTTIMKLFPFLALCLLTVTAACTSTPQSIVPVNLQGQISDATSFSQIKESPDSHTGTSILVGGEILSARRLKEHTRLTILQLPLNEDQEPITDRTQSNGRLIAVQSDFLDPATVPKGTRVTLVGKMTGSQTELLDEMEYTYPIFTIQHLRVWEDLGQEGYGHHRRFRPYRYPYWGPFWGRYGGFYSPYPYWYW